MLHAEGNASLVALPLCATASIISGSAGNVSMSRKQYIAGLADSCTSGFPNLNRIDGVLYNYGDFFTVSSGKAQVIIPSINFTCSGSGSLRYIEETKSNHSETS